MDDATSSLLDESRAWFEYLNQGDEWSDVSSLRHRIPDMSERYRINAANWLLRRSKMIAMYYGFGELMYVFHGSIPPGELAGDAIEAAMEREQDIRDADPHAWLQTTPLYKALTAGIVFRRRR